MTRNVELYKKYELMQNIAIEDEDMELANICEIMLESITDRLTDAEKCEIYLIENLIQTICVN